MEQLIGQSVGDSSKAQSARYRITDLLGKQTGRRTFLAEDGKTGGSVVIKLVLFGPDFAWEDLKLFEREAKTLKSLNHPRIPKYIDSFDVKTPLGQGFALVQTFIEAKSLQTWVEQGYVFSESELKAIAHDLLKILQYLHRRQSPIVHRDIKPSNILLTSQDNITLGITYLIDFGSVQTACPSGTITIVGTYGYMPPEQFGGRAGPASDLYSIGATLIYLATSKHPAELTQSNLQIEFNDSHLSRSFSDWLRQLTYIDLHRRTASAARALQQLDQIDKGNDSAACRSAVTPSNSQSKILKSTFADFSVYTDSQKLVVQLLESRTNIKEHILASRPLLNEDTFESHSQLSPAGAIAVACWIFSAHPLAKLLLKLGVEEPFNEPLAILCGIPVSATIFVVSTLVALRLKEVKTKAVCRVTIEKRQHDVGRLSLLRIASEEDIGWLQVILSKITSL